MMPAGGSVELPASKNSVGRSLYVFAGSGLDVNSEVIPSMSGVEVDSMSPLKLSSTGGCRLLVMQAKAIGEPIAQHGPFVMNTRDEIVQAFTDYQKTSFGGWPWPRNDMVHGSDGSRFAKFPDGRIEKPKKV